MGALLCSCRKELPEKNDLKKLYFGQKTMINKYNIEIQNAINTNKLLLEEITKIKKTQNDILRENNNKLNNVITLITV